MGSDAISEQIPLKTCFQRIRSAPRAAHLKEDRHMGPSRRLGLSLFVLSAVGLGAVLEAQQTAGAPASAESLAALHIAAGNAGAAVDAINSAVAELNAAARQKAKIATDLKVVRAAVSFVSAVFSVNPSQIISTDGALISALKGA